MTLAKCQMLLRTPETKADESFLGYIIRLAEQNGYESPGWVINLLNLRNISFSTCHAFMHPSSESFRLLTKLSGSDADKLSSLTYQPLGERARNIYLFFGAPVHRSFIRPNYPKVCPQCLRKTSYCRRIWEFALITVCPAHKCLLIDECPQCKERIGWRRAEVSKCPCGFDWREAPTSSVQGHELELARAIHRLCALASNEGASHVFPRNPTLRLSLHDLALAVIFMVGQLQGRSLTTGWPLISSRSVKDLHRLFTEAYCIFDDWPNHFYELLHQWYVQDKPVFPSYQRLQSVLYKEFGTPYFSLYKTLPDSQFNFLRDAFVDYLLEEWEGYDLSLLTGKRSTGRCHKIKYVSKSDARRLLGVEDALINHFIQNGMLKTKVRSKGMKRLIFVDLTDVANLAINPLLEGRK
jgi:hypothetical protein